MKISNLAYLLSLILNMHKMEYAGMIFFVTSKCNLRCKYCFNIDNLGRTDDLSFGEIEMMSNKLPNLNLIVYSGGEPLLRDDIVEISELFIENNKVRAFGIPTNCIDTENTLSKIEMIRKLHPGLSIVICCALDIFSVSHDNYRGKGAYDKASRTIKELVKYRDSGGKISILLNSVVLKDTIPNLLEFIKYAKKLNTDLHSIEVVRDKNNHFKKINHNDFEIIKKARLLIDELYRKSDLLYYMYRTRSKLITSIQEDVLLNGRIWPCLCNAGKTSFVVSSSGDVSLCENLPALGNLRQNDYDPISIIKKIGIGQFEGINEHACDCSHIVYLKDSVEYNFPKLFIKHIVRNVFGKN